MRYFIDSLALLLSLNNDYIPLNSELLDRKGWERSVNKMIQVMGAAIKDEDVQQIVDYLVAQYGK